MGVELVGGADFSRWGLSPSRNYGVSTLIAHVATNDSAEAISVVMRNSH